MIPGKGSAEYFWALRRHPIVLELGLTPPREEIHTFKYEHEKLCADVFVALYRTGSLTGWEQKKLSNGLIPDRCFYLGDERYYLEAEMGNQKDAILQKKIDRYKRYFRETGEKFQVRFVTPSEKTFNNIYKLLENETYHYQVFMLDALQKASTNYSNTLSNTIDNPQDPSSELIH